MRPLRVLAICMDYPPCMGGIATLSSQTIRCLSQLGHEVKVICSEPGGRDPVTGEPVSAVAEHHALGARAGLREWRLRRYLPRILSSFDADVVWSNTWFPGAAAVVLDQRSRHGRVLCFSCYASEIIPSAASLKQRVKGALGPVRRRCLEDADRILAVSRYTHDAVIRLGARPERTAVLPGGVAEEWFRVDYQAPRIPGRLLTVARLDPHKGHDVVLQALNLLARRIPDLHWEVIGPGQPADLQRLAQGLGVARCVTFTGVRTIHEIMEAMGRASVFVMPSREIPGRPDLIEGFGLSFLEAAACGLPAVGGRSGGVPDAIEDGITGFLVDPTSPPEVAQALARLVENPGLARQMGEAARQRAAREFAWTRIVQRMEKILEPALESVGRRL